MSSDDAIDFFDVRHVFDVVFAFDDFVKGEGGAKREGAEVTDGKASARELDNVVGSDGVVVVVLRRFGDRGGESVGEWEDSG